jgi:CBS domain-containing protein
MAIKAICKTELVTIDKSATIKDAAKLMKVKHVGSVIVTEGLNGKRIPSGIITDRDIALTMASESKPQDLPIQQIMQSKPITVKASEGIYETIIKMRENGIKRLPVVNDDGSLYGVVCADDLLSLMGEEINNLAKITTAQVNIEKGGRMPVEQPLNF